MKEQSKGAIENIQFSDIGMQALLEQKEFNTDTLQLDFIKKQNQTIKVHLSQWGIFEKGIAISQFRKKKFTKTAIIGSLLNTEESPTLFLQETYNALTVVGTTTIKGITYLPEQGVNSGYIAGQSYYGSQLVYGTVKKSTKELPQPKKNLLETLEYNLKQYKPLTEDDYISLEKNSKIINTFHKKTKAIYFKDPIVLEHKIITGNIIIKSETSIVIKNTAILKDVVLIAPTIEIEDGTTGAFQVIASKKITVGKACKLSYPSALVLFQDNKNNPDEVSVNPMDNKIFIDSKSIIKGNICYFQTKISSDFQTQILLEKEANIKGQVYCNGNFDLRGTVSGSVITKQFLANQSGSIFVNHIYNGTIENQNIPNIYGGIVLEQEQPKTILKWLY
ncbi:hypothetical protein [Flavobacterium sp. HTF]|uniref:hypothetical protein n=1 Tax=Flavobacterium sp. HTF TaxID=2170732 RepID=UPI001FAF284C|nr:hypothetical protein [Flavobacterium sp. HTF]